MKLIIGGAYQGKLDFAFKLLNTDKDRNMYALGGIDEIEETFARPVIYKFHEFIRELNQDEGGKLIKEILLKNPEAVIIMDELGYGIVPVSSEERSYRESCGRFGKLLASEASEVYRVICGIGQKIK